MKLAVPSNKMSKRIVPSNDHYKALRAIAVSTEDINRPAILFIAEPSKLDKDTFVIIQIPMDPTLPEDEWNSANTAKQQYPLLPTDGTPEDLCQTYHNVDRIIAACTRARRQYGTLHGHAQNHVHTRVAREIGAD